MAKCPYTWVRGLFRGGSKDNVDPSKPAENLMVRVVRDGEERMLVALPAKSARWLIELIPGDVVEKIRAEDIPLDDISRDLTESPVLHRGEIFTLDEERRQVKVWLE
jgi:hypothetical protein